MMQQTTTTLHNLPPWQAIKPLPGAIKKAQGHEFQQCVNGISGCLRKWGSQAAQAWRCW